MFTVTNFLQLKDRLIGFTVPGRIAAMYPVGDGGQARVLLLWRSPNLVDCDCHDLAQQQKLIAPSTAT